MSIDNQNEWLETSLGLYIQKNEQRLFDQAVSDIFGFNAIQIGMSQLDYLQNSRIPHVLKLDSSRGNVLCDTHQLPIASSTIDLILLPHCLEFSNEPHQTLREAERVLVPEGHIIISGFNPLSVWGLRRLLSKKCNYPWYGHFITLLRIKDWLALLGMELVSVQMTSYVPPFSKPGWLNRFDFLDGFGEKWCPMLGGCYFIVAKKRVIGMRMIKPTWSKSRLKAGLVSVPSQKTDHQKKRYE